MASSLEMVNARRKFVILWLGKPHSVRGSGLFAIVPIIDSVIAAVYARIQTTALGQTILLSSSLVDGLNLSRHILRLALAANGALKPGAGLSPARAQPRDARSREAPHRRPEDG